VVTEANATAVAREATGMPNEFRARLQATVKPFRRQCLHTHRSPAKSLICSAPVLQAVLVAAAAMVAVAAAAAAVRLNLDILRKTEMSTTALETTS
jgi:hypothetical protein